MNTVHNSRKKLLFLFAMVLFVMGCTLTTQAASKRQNVILNGNFVVQTFTADEDLLWWDFTVPSAGKLTITTQTFRPSTYFNLFNEDQTTNYFRQQFNSGSEGAPETQKAEIWLKAGSYQYRAADNMYLSYAGDGDVRVKIEFEAANETETEINDTMAKAMPLKANTQVKGVLTKDDRYDFYALQVTKAGTVSFTVTSYADAYAVTVYNPAEEKVDQYDEAQTKSSYLQADGSVEAPKVYKRTFTADRAGTYFIKFSDNYFGEDHTFGTYLLSWQTQCVTHTYGSGTVTKEPTTDHEGEKTYTCVDCGEKKTETIDKLPAADNNNTQDDTSDKGQETTAPAANQNSKPVQTVNNSGTLKKEKQLIVLQTTKKTVSYKKLKKSAQSFKLKAVSSKGKLTFKKVSGSKRIVISKKGTVKVGKKLKKGTYKVKVKITAAAAGIYKKTTVTRTFKIVVK